MVMGDVGVQCDFDWIAGAFTLQLAACLVGVTLLDAIVNERVQ